MKVSVNSKKKILKSFLGWLPLALVSLIIYGAIFLGIIVWLLTSFAGFEEALARDIGWIASPILLSFSFYIYLRNLTSSLSSYWLSIEGETLRVRGKNGWRLLNTELPVRAVKKIYIGQYANAAEKLASGHGAIQDQVESRLTFFPESGKPFRLDFATKAFDNNSLYEFLLFAKSKGIDINICV